MVPNQSHARDLLKMFGISFPPAMLFYGPKGSGQLEIALEYFEGTYVKRDYHFFNKPKLDDLITLRNPINTKPEKKYKLIIIDQVDKISKEASNFLLKVIEDAPDYLRWVLISESNHIQNPMKSRCFLVPFRAFNEIDNDFSGSLFLKKEMEQLNCDFIKRELIDTLKSKEYYKFLLFNVLIKKLCSEITSEMELLRNSYLYCCNVMMEFYKKDFYRLNQIQKTKNIIKNQVRSETRFKTMFMEVL